MKQSRTMSLLETTLSTAAGFGLSLAAQASVLPPLLGITISLEQNVEFALVMTVVSIARQFGMRRLFEMLHIRVPLSAAALAVLAERRRQIEAEGWTVEHDDEHATGEMARAGACYAIAKYEHPLPGNPCGRYVPADELWPWAAAWWKPQDFRRDLVRAAALILAEIEKFDRAKRKARRA